MCRVPWCLLWFAALTAAASHDHVLFFSCMKFCANLYESGMYATFPTGWVIPKEGGSKEDMTCKEKKKWWRDKACGITHTVSSL